MATTYIEELAPHEGRTVSKTVADVLEYVTAHEKTLGGELVTASGCYAETAAFEMLALQRQYEQATGRRVDEPLGEGRTSHILLSLRQSFAPNEVTPDEAHRIGCALARRYIGDRFQYVVATHVNSHCLHNHIIVNIVGDDLRKFRTNKFSYQKVQQLSDRLCKESGLSVLPPNCGRRHPLYSKRDGISFRTELKNDVDRAVAESASFAEFLDRMREEYFVKATGKHLSFRHRTNGQQRNIRAYSLGSAYTEAAIRERVSGEETIETRVVSAAQSVKNVEALFAAAAFFRENGVHKYSQISEKLSELTEAGQAVERELETVSAQTQKLSGLLQAASDYRRCAHAAEGLSRALLKERYFEEPREELALYRAAEQKLLGLGVRPETLNMEKIQNELEAYSEKSAGLARQWEAQQEKLAAINKMKRVIDRAYQNKAVVTEREDAKRDR